MVIAKTRIRMDSKVYYPGDILGAEVPQEKIAVLLRAGNVVNYSKAWVEYFGNRGVKVMPPIVEETTPKAVTQLKEAAPNIAEAGPNKVKAKVVKNET